jgi:hypothetical protein
MSYTSKIDGDTHQRAYTAMLEAYRNTFVVDNFSDKEFAALKQIADDLRTAQSLEELMGNAELSARNNFRIKNPGEVAAHEFRSVIDSYVAIAKSAFQNPAAAKAR